MVRTPVDSCTVTVAPAPVDATCSTVTPRRSVTHSYVATCSSRTASRWSWATHAGALGLSTRLWADVGTPTSISVPSPARAAVGISSMVISTSSAPARTRSSSPHERRISIVRRLSTVARGIGEPDGLRSRSRTSTPDRAIAIVAMRPAAPAPTTTTS